MRRDQRYMEEAANGEPVYYAAISPLTGPELLTDPGLEGDYTSGKCNALTLKGGTPTLAESADAHDGSKAQEFTATANQDYIRFANKATASNLWYMFSAWGKRTAQSRNTTNHQFYQSSGFSVAVPIVSSNYANTIIVARTKNTNEMQPIAVTQNTDTIYNTVIVDDFSLKLIYFVSTLRRTRGTPSGDVSASVAVSCILNTQIGMAINLDSVSNPQNFVLAYIDRGKAYLDKCVNGVYSTVMTPTAITYVADKIINATKSGTTYKLYYNGSQVGVDQTIEDAGIINNTLHRQFSTYGGNRFLSWDVTPF